MAIAYRAKSALSAAGTVNVPAGVQDDDLLVAVIYGSDDDGTGVYVFTDPAGWTVDSDIHEVILAGLQANYLHTAVRKASSEPASYDWAFTGVSLNGTILAYSGVDTATALDAASTTAKNTTSSAPRSPAITTVTDSAMVLSLVSSDAGTTAGPAGMTVRDAAADECADAVKTPAGIYTPNGWTPNGRWLGVTMALRPAGGAPPAAVFFKPRAQPYVSAPPTGPQRLARDYATTANNARELEVPALYFKREADRRGQPVISAPPSGIQPFARSTTAANLAAELEVPALRFANEQLRRQQPVVPAIAAGSQPYPKTATAWMQSVVAPQVLVLAWPEFQPPVGPPRTGPQPPARSSLVADQGQPIVSASFVPPARAVAPPLAAPAGVQPMTDIAPWASRPDLWYVAQLEQLGVLAPAAAAQPVADAAGWIADQGQPVVSTVLVFSRPPLAPGALATGPQPFADLASWVPLRDYPVPGRLPRAVDASVAGLQPEAPAWLALVPSDFAFTPWLQPRAGAALPGPQPLVTIAAWVPLADLAFAARSQLRAVPASTRSQFVPPIATWATSDALFIRAIVGPGAPASAAQPFLDAATFISEQGQPAFDISAFLRRRTQPVVGPAGVGRQPFASRLAWILPPAIGETPARLFASARLRTILAAAAAVRSILATSTTPRRRGVMAQGATRTQIEVGDERRIVVVATSSLRTVVDPDGNPRTIIVIERRRMS